MEEYPIEGFLLVDKPADMTSFKCISHIRWLLPKKTKVGHTGTLDRFATGLLVVAVARSATRVIPQIMPLDKTYIATGVLGQKTNTLDIMGDVVHVEKVPDITRADIEKVLESFGSGYTQIPPLFSALKHQGVRLSDLARTKEMSQSVLQKVAEKKSRLVKIYSLELLDFESPRFTISAHVSHGTYIRVLVNDIAVKLGTCATTHVLRRTAIGPFNVDKAIKLHDMNTHHEVDENLIPITTMVEKLEEYKSTII